MKERFTHSIGTQAFDVLRNPGGRDGRIINHHTPRERQRFIDTYEHRKRKKVERLRARRTR